MFDHQMFWIGGARFTYISVIHHYDYSTEEGLYKLCNVPILSMSSSQVRATCCHLCAYDKTGLPVWTVFSSPLSPSQNPPSFSIKLSSPMARITVPLDPYSYSPYYNSHPLAHSLPGCCPSSRPSHPWGFSAMSCLKENLPWLRWGPLHVHFHATVFTSLVSLTTVVIRIILLLSSPRIRL